MNDLITDEEREEIKQRVTNLYLSNSKLFHMKLYDQGIIKLPKYKFKQLFNDELKVPYLFTYYVSLINKTGANWRKKKKHWKALNHALDNYKPQ